jgi:hypothetical protein
MLYRSKLYRTGLKAGMLLTAVVLGLAQAALAVTPTTTVPPLILSGRQSDRPAGTYSPGITEIIKMLDAKLDAPVILAYIQNSTIPYDPEATELIVLKEHGASTETLVALLHRGDEVRLQLAQAQGVANPSAVAPAYDYPPAAYLAYPYAYDDSSYAPNPPTDYSYATGWPLAYWPSVGISAYGPYRYAHRHYYPRSGCPNWASAVRPTPYSQQSVSAPSGGHTGSPVVHSGGSQSSGRSGGRSGGRSR